MPFKWDCPSFSHTLIHGHRWFKTITKRHGALGIGNTTRKGYLPEAVINYLLRLGGAHGDQEIFCKEEMIDLFSIEKIRKSPAKFDIEKLDDINSKYLKNTSVQILLKNFDKNSNEINEEKIKSIEIILPELLKRFKNIKEIEKNLEFIINQRPININGNIEFNNDKSIKTLENLSKVLKKLDKWDANEIEHTIKKFLIDEKLNFKRFRFVF